MDKYLMAEAAYRNGYEQGKKDAVYGLIYSDWYERLSNLEFVHNPQCDGGPWYRADDVWSCIRPQDGGAGA